MLIRSIIQELENFAPLQYQESYDNCGLIVGNAQWECTGVLCCLDSTEAVINEAIENGCNLVVAHHPIVFSGLKKINGKNYVERTIITAIKNDIAIYAIHTNADNIINGVNDKIASKLGLINKKILVPKENLLAKLITYIPDSYLETVQQVLFDNGAGNIGNYSDASFASEGLGTFKANNKANPFIGEPEKRHEEAEKKLEVLIPLHKKEVLIDVLKKAHPYEEVAYEVIALNNVHNEVGSGMIGELPTEMNETDFLKEIKTTFGLSVIKHTALLNKPIKKVSVCGGAGSFLIKHSIQSGADIFISSDIKYHEFFDADKRIIVADIGHWESEQFTPDIIIEVLRAKFPIFAVLKSKVNTNSVSYFI
jgi:dinuclear metal center YbgI/SA1388 family protein